MSRSPVPQRAVPFRREPVAEDITDVHKLISDTGVFTPDEADMAADLVRARLQRGPRSGYHFLFAESGTTLNGYTCFGPIECTDGSFDLYWIAVAPACRHLGLGRSLMEAAVSEMRSMGARRLYIETSSTPNYAPARSFYRSLGFELLGTLEDFYRPGDHKLFFGSAL